MAKMRSRAEKKAKKSRIAIILLILLLGFAIFSSGYYMVDSLITENSYKLYVGGRNTTTGKGISLSYDPDFGQGYQDLNGKGLRLESQSRMGMAYGTSSVTNNSKSYSVFDYLMSVGSNLENTVDTNVTDKGKTGEANNDEFVTSKFYLRNETKVDLANGENGIVQFKIGLDITKNEKNALSAARFALIEVYDEENIFKPSSVSSSGYGTSDNTCFDFMIFGQPKIVKEGEVPTALSGEEENSQEFVGAIGSGAYTSDEDAVLVKNPNKDHEKENWLCTNLHRGEDGSWSYDSKLHEDKSFTLNPGEQKAYVVAAWYEASDPDHNESVMDGYTSFTFTFTVI